MFCAVGRDDIGNVRFGAVCAVVGWFLGRWKRGFWVLWWFERGFGREGGRIWNSCVFGFVETQMEVYKVLYFCVILNGLFAIECYF